MSLNQLHVCMTLALTLLGGRLLSLQLGFMILILVAAYTANLAAFITTSAGSVRTFNLSFMHATLGPLT